MRLVWIALLGLAAEIGWLVVCSLSGPLSHSSAFTSGLRAWLPVLDVLVSPAANAWPALATAAPPLTDQLGQPGLIGPAAALGGALVWLGLVYSLGLVVLNRGAGASPGAVWLVLGWALVFQATLLGMPGLFSQDVFSYLAYGHLATDYGLNPYVWPPSAIAKDPLVDWVAGVWQTYACPYGPLWVDVQSALALALDRLPVPAQALAYRGLANVLQLLNVGLVWLLLGRLVPLRRAERVAALAAFAWNPLLLFELAGNAHNDVLMVSLSLVGVLLLARAGSRLGHGNLALEVAACVWLTLGALVKYVSGIGLVWLAVACAAPAGRTRLRRSALLALVSLALAAALSIPWLELPDSLDPLLNETAGVGYVNDLPDQLTLALARQLGSVADALGPARLFERGLGLAIFGVYLLWEARRVSTDGRPASVVRATVLSVLVYVLLVSTSMQPWYFALPVSLAVLLGLRSALARVTLAYAGLALPTLYSSYYLRDLLPGVVWLGYGAGPLLLLLPGWRGRPGAWWRGALARRTNLPAEPEAEAGELSLGSSRRGRVPS